MGFGFLPAGKTLPSSALDRQIKFSIKQHTENQHFFARGVPWGFPEGILGSTPLARRPRLARRRRWRCEVDSAARSMTRRSRWCDEVDGAARSTARRGRWRGEVDCAAMSMARLGRWLGDVDGIAISIIIVIVIVIITARTAKLVPRGSKMATQRLKNQPWRHQDSPK